MLCIDEEFICIYFGQIETVCNLLGRAHSAAGHTWFRCLLLAERQAYSWHCHVSTRLCVFHRDSVAKCRLYASTCRHEWTKIRTKLFEYSKVRRFVSFPVMASQAKLITWPRVLIWSACHQAAADTQGFGPRPSCFCFQGISHMPSIWDLVVHGSGRAQRNSLQEG